MTASVSNKEMMVSRISLFLALVACHVAVAQEPLVTKLVARTCLACHNDKTSSGGLNLSRLKWDLENDKNRRRWIHIHDRIAAGEMPPGPETMAKKDRQAILSVLSGAIHNADFARVLAAGRGPMRRLTRREYEQNLRDLLQLPRLDVRDMVPADREKYHCTKVAEVLDMSRVQLAAYLTAADASLRQAVASQVQAPKPVQLRLPATRMFYSAHTFGGREAMFYAKNSQMVPIKPAELSRLRKENKHDPEMELAIFRSASWPYYGYPDTFAASRGGAYRVRFSARAVRQSRDFRLRPARESIPFTFRARKRSGPDVSGDVRGTGGIIDIQPKVAVYETTIWLKSNETFEYSLLGLPVPRAINPDDGPLYYDFPPMPKSGHPGIAFQWLEISGPLVGKQWPPASHRVLFDRLPIRPIKKKGRLAVQLVSKEPKSDARRLLRRFIRRAERRPTSLGLLKSCESLVLREIGRGEPLAEALISGYSAFLCAPEFLYLPEPKATRHKRSYHFDIATRLSHFLANTRCDPKLTSYAAQQKLLDLRVLRQQTDRLIEAPTFENFVTNFTDDWLALKYIRRDQPDIRLYPEYRFDDYLITSMEAETRAFFRAMVRNNLSVTALVDTDFAFVNDRLAAHYDLKPIRGSSLRRVRLPKGSVYGGLLTQAAIMKVTANGTTTSPVRRGAWIMERIMGDPPPPPPKSVTAISPDLRGAVTIREQLARHTTDASCAKCHARFDPVGLALENFDIMGAWRDRYRSLAKGEQVTGIDRAGHQFLYHIAARVDPSGRLKNGSAFRDIRQLKSILKNNPRQLARNLLHQLVLYATGTPVRFSDRRVIEKVLDRCHKTKYRTRDLIHGLVQSRIFTGAHK